MKKLYWSCVLKFEDDLSWFDKWVVVTKADYGHGGMIPNEDILGLVERNQSGEWLCFIDYLEGVMKYVGFETSRPLAQALVVKELIKKDIRSRLVLEGKISGAEGPEMQGPGQGEDEFPTD